MYPLMSVDFHVIAVLAGVMVAPFEWMMLVVNVDVLEPEVSIIVLSDIDAACSCHLTMCILRGK